MRRSFIALSLTSVLTACSAPDQPMTVMEDSAAGFSIVLSDGVGLTDIERNKINNDKLETKLAETLNFCLPRLSGYEIKSADQARNAYWLSMSGLVAGSIAVPALTAASAAGNAVWIAAAGGWAGATNFASQQLQSSGLSGSTIAKTRNEIVKSVSEQIEIATNTAQPPEVRAAAIMKARAQCVLHEISVPTVSTQK
ncbi:MULTISPECIES: hypothetical protein [Vibrio]|uniref:Lipoprotein n=1 Tax=Vibrio hepatarius TaxID=171383 RepID=A0A0M0I0P0_9VIBR|nr:MULTISPECIES: hypothetical protein [Vibrio]KOO07904.1 hypothetical protein AKJ31_09390 [Vibrio hepatarius]POC39052.1 hypothetical protein CRN55_07440 [Vibrio vulnificus]